MSGRGCLHWLGVYADLPQNNTMDIMSFLCRQVLMLGVYASHGFGYLRVKNNVVVFF